jgi:hypothetical protein
MAFNIWDHLKAKIYITKKVSKYTNLFKSL